MALTRSYVMELAQWIVIIFIAVAVLVIFNGRPRS